MSTAQLSLQTLNRNVEDWYRASHPDSTPPVRPERSAIEGPAQRSLRDIHAVTQHIATSPQQFETGGRMLLGLDPANPFLLL